MTRRAAAVLLAAVSCGVALAGCRGDSTARRSTPGADADATPAVTATAAASGSGGGASPMTSALATTGTTAAARPGQKLTFPRAGTYRFREVVTHEGNEPVDRTTYFTMSSPAPKVVRVQETDASADPKIAAYYDERHDPDGLWLVSSATSAGACTWEPRAASLPQRVIDGGTVSSDATCPVGGSRLRLQVTVAFDAVREVTIDGRRMRAVDVRRQRVLSEGETSISSDAVDTYVFALGLRVAVSERTTTTDRRGERAFTRTLVLESLRS